MAAESMKAAWVEIENSTICVHVPTTAIPYERRTVGGL